MEYRFVPYTGQSGEAPVESRKEGPNKLSSGPKKGTSKGPMKPGPISGVRSAAERILGALLRVEPSFEQYAIGLLSDRRLPGSEHTLLHTLRNSSAAERKAFRNAFQGIAALRTGAAYNASSPDALVGYSQTTAWEGGVHTSQQYSITPNFLYTAGQAGEQVQEMTAVSRTPIAQQYTGSTFNGIYTPLTYGQQLPIMTSADDIPNPQQYDTFNAMYSPLPQCEHLQTMAPAFYNAPIVQPYGNSAEELPTMSTDDDKDIFLVQFVNADSTAGSIRGKGYAGSVLNKASVDAIDLRAIWDARGLRDVATAAAAAAEIRHGGPGTFARPSASKSGNTKTRSTLMSILDGYSDADRPMTPMTPMNTNTAAADPPLPPLMQIFQDAAKAFHREHNTVRRIAINSEGLTVTSVRVVWRDVGLGATDLFKAKPGEFERQLELVRCRGHVDHLRVCYATYQRESFAGKVMRTFTLGRASEWDKHV
ncbi:hypothetical protein DL764_009115 [Monosporascus ibericus]|uniref:Uncharacterized protein n=1 Tax=Monosporascus ibericus TaxID=155417 RepID=A0A4Q4SVT9_9PEZI|nr:hypothetical protein DL764_009115 [Monosporascus ibericus]